VEVHLQEGESLDDLQNGYKIIQNKDEFCFGIDAVLLSWFAKVRPQEVILDMCCGNGAVPLLMKGRYEGGHYTGLEIQEEAAKLAKKSVVYNGLEESICIKIGDVKEATTRLGTASFDVITCNPPYMIGEHGAVNENLGKAIARHEILCTLEDIVSQAAKVLKVKGRFYMVHRPFRLAEIMVVMAKYKVEPKRIQFVYPYIDKEPTMVLIEGVLGGKPRVKVEKPLIVYTKRQEYTQEVMNIYYGPPKEEDVNER